MKKSVLKSVSVILSVLMIISLSAFCASAFSYEHDPLDNPKAMADIIVNENAVYGFSPNPDSTRLGVYANALDWTDPEQVAAARAQRIEYHAKNAELYKIIEDGRANGESTEEIARKVSQRRNELRLEAYKDDPAGLALVKQSNLETYGDESGPTAEWLYEKYGDWQTVIDKACSSNAGMDACLGLYDEMYYTYGLEESELPDEPASTDTADVPVTPEVVAAPEDETQDDAVTAGIPQTVSAEQKTPPTGDSGAIVALSAVSLITLGVTIATKRKKK